MDSTVAMLLIIITSLILWFLVAPVLIYYTYKFWRNSASAIRIKQQSTLSVLLSFVVIINSTFSVPLITLIYIYYYDYDLNNTLYLSLYPFIVCLFSFIYLEPLIYNIRLFTIYFQWQQNVDLVSLKLNHSNLLNSRSCQLQSISIKSNKKTININNAIAIANSDNKFKEAANGISLQSMYVSDSDYDLSPSHSPLPWTIKYRSIFGNLKFMVFVIIFFWISSTLILWFFIGPNFSYSCFYIFEMIISFILTIFTFILTIFVLQFNGNINNIDFQKELIAITSLIVLGIIGYAVINIFSTYSYSNSFQRIFCIFLLIEIIQILIVFRMICAEISCIDNIVDEIRARDTSRYNTFGGSFFSDTINLTQILNDENGFKAFAQYLISELNVSHLLFLCDFINLQNYMIRNEWIKDEFIANFDISLNDDGDDDDDDDDDCHNTVGQCINDINYIYHLYLKQNAMANVYILMNEERNIKLLIDEFTNNKDLNNKNELQVLKAIYIQYENISHKIYTSLSEQSINRFMLSNQYKNWKTASYKTFS